MLLFKDMAWQAHTAFPVGELLIILKQPLGKLVLNWLEPLETLNRVWLADVLYLIDIEWEDWILLTC